MGVPKLRFKKDDGSEFPEWEESSFSETFTGLNNNTLSRDSLNEQKGTFQDIHYGDILIKYGSIVNMNTDTVPFINDNIDCSKYALLKDGDIVIADTAEDETAGKAIEIQNVRDKLVVSGLHTMAWRSKEQFAPMYLGYYMNSSTYHGQLRPYMQGIKVTSISKANIALTTIARPCVSEQQQIAKLFNTLDFVIELTRSEITAWKKQKRGVMQLLFSRKVRFKADDGSEFPEWEEKNFKEIATYFSGGTPAVGKEEFYNGNIPFIRSGELHSDITELYLSEAGLGNSSAKMVEIGDVLYALYGATSGDVSISKINGAINQAILCIRPYQDYGKQFIVFVLQYFKDAILNKYLQGGQGNLSAKIIKGLRIQLPCLIEQQKIAACLSGFDDVIDKAKRELEAYRELKKGLLQQMFV